MHVLEGIIQGSPQWLAIRAEHFTASEAPAMLGVSKYQTRSDLLKQKATGIAADVDGATQRLFDRGHASEAEARPHAEALAGDDLFPVTATLGIDGLKLLASLDGATMAEDVIWEHKLYSEALAADVRAGTLSQHYTVQMDQQLLVSGARKCLFMTSDGTPDRMAWCWYESTPEKQSALVAGWKQFAADLSAYKPAEVVAEVVAEPVEALPAVLVKVSGELSITANFGAFETKLREFLEHRLIREPKTDQDFADLDLQIKAMKAGREAIKGAKAQMLAQVQPVDVANKTADMLDDLLQKNCAMAERLLKDEKERRKNDLVIEHQTALREHCKAVSDRVGVPICGIAEFGAVIKGLKSLSSMEDKLGAELARAKIEASLTADSIQVNRTQMDNAEAAHLFPDFVQVCMKGADDFANLITSRKQAEAKRIEAERERIRAEEAARLEREAKAKEQARIAAELQAERVEAQLKRERDAELNTKAQIPQQVLKAEPATAEATDRGVSVISSPSVGSMGAGQAADAAPSASAAAPRAGYARTLRLGEIQSRLAPLSITAEGLAQLGFPAHTERGLKLYWPGDFPAICRAISARVLQAATVGELEPAL